MIVLSIEHSPVENFLRHEVAANSGFPVRFIKDIEAEKANPSFLDLFKLADVLGAFPSDFFEFEFVNGELISI